MPTSIRARALVPSLETQDDTWRTSEQSGCLGEFSISRISPNVRNSPMIADDEATANILVYYQLPTPSLLCMSSPCEEVPETSKKAANSAIFAGRNRSPVIDPS